MNSLPYRPNVSMLLFSNSFDLFLGERSDLKNSWQFPQGGIEKALSLEENVLKELNEEIGASYTLFKLVKQLSSTHTYDFYSTPEVYRDKFRGQSQVFYLVKFLGNDVDINLNAYIHPEFQNFMWCNPEKVLQTVDPIRIAGYKAPLNEFLEYSIPLK